MAGNTSPIFVSRGQVSTDGVITSSATMSQAITTASADYTGAGAANALVFTAESTKGSFVERIRFKASGTNTASVARIFINNGADNTSAANNTFYGEQTLTASTASAVIATNEIDYAMNIALPPGFRIYVGLGTTVAAGWTATAIGGDYIL